MISSHPRCCADNKRQFGGSEFPANPGVITPAQLCALTSDEKDDQRSVWWPVDDGPLRTFVTDCRALLMIIIIISQCIFDRPQTFFNTFNPAFAECRRC
jgi:hypothetical protein